MKILVWLLIILFLFYLPVALGFILIFYNSVEKNFKETHAINWQHRKINSYIKYKKNWYSAKIEVLYLSSNYITYRFTAKFNAKIHKTILNISLWDYPQSIKNNIFLLTKHLQK